MKDRTIRTRSGVISLREDGILCFSPSPGVHHDEEAARENLEACRQLLGDNVVPVLVDVREAGSMTREARQLYTFEAKFIAAQGLIAGSAFSRIVAALFVRLAPRNVPMRMFTSEDKALAWLRRFLA